MYHQWKPYVSVAARKRKAAQQMAKLKKKGHPVAPVVVEGRVIAKTFWGKSWCENLEGYGDYENRLPRGRTYVRNGSVVDLQIDNGAVAAWVSGSELYKVEVKIATLPKARWSTLVEDCAGEIDSLVELLQGQFSQGVMQRMCTQDAGLFPAPKEISFDCSCPDWASMCKHVAAVLYGVGARLDERPELLFALRAVSEQDLITKAGKGLRTTAKKPKSAKLLDATDLSDVFGIELADATPRKRVAAVRTTAKKRAGTRKTATRVSGVRKKRSAGKR
jgi:uncharacterized Zn finger protein